MKTMKTNSIINYVEKKTADSTLISTGNDSVTDCRNSLIEQIRCGTGRSVTCL